MLPPIQVSAEKKQTGSTVGMQTSVETSALLKVGLLGTVETRALPKVGEWSEVLKVQLPWWVDGSRGPGPRPTGREYGRLPTQSLTHSLTHLAVPG